MLVRTSVADVIPNDDSSTTETPPTGQAEVARSTSSIVAAWCMIGIVGVVGVLVRWLVLRSPAGVLNPDEAYTGVQSFDILNGRFPVVLGGTNYTLPLEAYLYAPFAAMFGTSVVMIKLISTVSWALTSLGIYFVGARLSSRRTGLVVGALYWLTPGALLLLSVTAYSAYASGMLVTVAAFYVASRVIDAEAPSWWLGALFGLLAGFGFWLHPMFLATLVPMTLVVLWMHRRRLATCAAVVVGGIVGCAPLLAWNAVNSWPSLSSPADVKGTYPERLRTFGVNLIPRAFGLRDGNLHWQPNAVVGPILYATLIGFTVAGAVLLMRRSGPRSRVLLPAVLIGVFPIMALFQNLIYVFDGRYGIIAFPFILLAVSITIDELMGRASMRRTVAVIVAVAVVWAAGFIVPTVKPLVDAGESNPNQAVEEIVGRLDAAGIDRVYGSYWAVLPIDYFGDRHIVGGVFPSWPIRFPARQRILGATPTDRAAVVFLVSDEDTTQLLMPAEQYDRIVVGPYVIYLPKSTPPAG